MKTTDFDLLSVLTGTMILALALTRFLVIPLRPLLQVTVFGSPLAINLSALNVMIVLVLGLAVTGTAVFLRSHPFWERAAVKHTTMFWIGPGLLSMALVAWLHRMHSGLGWTAVLLGCAILLPLALLVEYGEIDAAGQDGNWRPWVQTALFNLTAVILFTVIYDARLRSLVSGTAVLLIAVLLAARLFWPLTPNLRQTFTYAAIIGLVLGEMTWVLNYWRLSGLQGGFLLLLLFYGLTGLLQQYLAGQFEDKRNGRRILLEYGGVILIGLLVVGTAVP
ncbi:MAG: hypothetical protein H6667_13850 [Ardenticatenaceae bacterium]|nr:hypothetical protein [Ardenticatenaceae bacterium]